MKFHKISIKFQVDNELFYFIMLSWLHNWNAIVYFTSSLNIVYEQYNYVIKYF